MITVGELFRFMETWWIPAAALATLLLLLILGEVAVLLGVQIAVTKNERSDVD